jgi:hypothetical protein
MKNLFLAATALSLLTGCQFFGRVQKCQLPAPASEARARGWPAVLDYRNRQEIQAAAVADARTDIAVGKPRAAWTGGIASWAVGVPVEYIGLLKNLPNVPLPSGCTEPLLEQASIYAEAYNGEILAYLLHKQNFSSNEAAITE